MIDLLLLLLLVAPIAIVVAVARNRRLQRELRAATAELVVDEFGVRRELADGREEGVDWTELTEIEVYRTDKGPHAPSGGFIMLSGDDTRGCLVPLDHLESSGLLEGLERLRGFNGMTFTEALIADPPSQLVVWRRDA